MSIRAQVSAAIDANPGLPHHVLARKVAADMGDEAMVALAIRQVEQMIVTERRKRSRDIESNSSTAHPTGDPSKWQAVDALLEEYRAAIIVDWTSELLAAEFATGDGRRVTWGQATVEVHVGRIQMLTANVRGNLDAIRRHEAAIQTISDLGGSCLDEVVKR